MLAPNWAHFLPHHVMADQKPAITNANTAFSELMYEHLFKYHVVDATPFLKPMSIG
jgi:hypothetical protein